MLKLKQMLMQFVWLIFIYFLTGLSAGFSFKRKHKPKNRIAKIEGPAFSIKPHLISAMAGLGGVMIADWLSSGAPIWPALALVSGVLGGFFPVPKRPNNELTFGLGFYWGGIFYLRPVIALIGLIIALECLILSKDIILTLMIFNSLIPVIFHFVQVNPLFFWASLCILIISLVCFRREVGDRILNFCKAFSRN